MKVKHIKQAYNYSCGAAAFAMITGFSEKESMLLCKTKLRGTELSNAALAFKQLNYSCSTITVEDSFSNVWWLKSLSFHFPIYVSARFISNSGRGRNRQRKHAIVLAHGKIFDPAEDFEIDFDCYAHTFNKDLLIREIIVIDNELDGYGQNRHKNDIDI